MEELADDDAEMAGIVPSQMPRTHRIWSRPLLKDRNEDLEVSESMIEARKHVHRSLLRRLIRRPPLDKTRSLSVHDIGLDASEKLCATDHDDK
ncbi:unnamed protein product [Penicillium manginii]